MTMDSSVPKHWHTIESQPGPDLKIFKVRYDIVRNPRNSLEMKAVILETPDWVNVIAVTRTGKILVVDQYRFGAQNITTEIPAGMVSPGETPQQAAIRELREETGFESPSWSYLGWVEPNPAFHDNRCHQFLARDAERTGPLKPEESESITVRELTQGEIISEIAQGKMRNSLALLALSHVFNIWGSFQSAEYTSI